MSLSLTLGELAKITDSQLVGDGDCIISGVASIERAGEGDISFVRDAKYKTFLAEHTASAVILPEALTDLAWGNQLVNPDPYLTYAKVVTALYPYCIEEVNIHKTAVIAATAQIADGVFIGANVVIGENTVIHANTEIHAGSYIGDDCVIGCDTRIYPNVTISSRTIIGDKTILHSGVVLGADGFGFAPDGEEWYKIPQVGNVVIGANVEIGANTTIDRAAMGSTEIGDGVKIDNLIQIGHNTKIGKNTAIAAHTAIAGSTEIGERCKIAGAVAIGGHIQIADDVTITGTSMVIHSIQNPGVYSSGTVATSNKEWRKNAVRFSQLNQMAGRISQLEKQIAELKGKE